MTFLEGKPAAADGPSPGVLATEQGYWTRVLRVVTPVVGMGCPPKESPSQMSLYPGAPRWPLGLLAGRDRRGHWVATWH